MWVQMVLTGMLSVGLATAVMTRGLPPIAYTIPDRLAVFTGPSHGFGNPPEKADAMAGLRAR